MSLGSALRRSLRPMVATRDFLRLPPAARAAHLRDRLAGAPATDVDPARAVDAAAHWLYRAQDRSTSQDGGVARHYSLVSGWGASYPETTGYIVPTLLAYARWRGEREAADRARRMLDWLVSIQFPDGGFPGGVVGQTPWVPVTFNTGQILLGLSAGVREFGDYAEAMQRAADWLVRTQDADGCWRRHPTPFAAAGEKTYETHVAWGLLEAARVTNDPRYAGAALANVRWALRHQSDNGWFARCCLEDPSAPLTHTIGYALRGVLEAYRYNREPLFLRAARRTADALLGVMRADGFIPGRLRKDWSGAVPWACLTGAVQLAICWLLLFEETGEGCYRDAAVRATAFVRRTIEIDAPDNIRGGVKGSFPVSGSYGRYEYLNWAAKFFIDAQMLALGGAVSRKV
ncbi:hypothetical protein L6Q96_09345 [Candidatus Binatia bacterium]|nr:hypothetical protein [Candidatus Binatia bacterium]